ncbi:hypothetical protein BDW22DRAFT_1428167 [Trametopsis cervina]|nr:hypothetical protein BDW22DRAFT_1428167 [Trametopsis cervina]
MSSGPDPSNGPPPSPDIDGHSLAVLLWGGLYFSEFLRMWPLDWRILTGQRGCRWGAFVLFFPFQALAGVYVGCSIALLFPPPWQPPSPANVHYIQVGAGLLSRTFGFHILALRVSSVWNFWAMSWSLSAIILGLWAAVTLSLSRLQTQWFLEEMPTVLTTYALCLTTLILALFIAGLTRARIQGRYSSVCPLGRYAEHPVSYMIRKEKLHLVTIVWIAELVSSVSIYGKIDNGPFSAIQPSCFIAIVVCGSRVYQHAVGRGKSCPTRTFPYLCSKSLTWHKNKPRDAGPSMYDTEGPLRSQQLPALRVITEDRPQETIELTTFPSDIDSAVSPTSQTLIVARMKSSSESEPSLSPLSKKASLNKEQP